MSISKEELNKKLKQIKYEDYIWIIYIAIIFLSFYSNNLERKYYLFNDKKSKEMYQNIMIIIFLILLFVYIYFFIDAYDSFKDLKTNDNKKKKELITLSFISSSLILISGIIFLYIAINNKELDVELAFN